MKDIFQIFKVTEKNVAQFIEVTYEPHQHNFEELIICLTGNAEHFIDFNTQKFEAPFISYISKGKLHKLTVDLTKPFLFWVIRFRSEFIPETIFNLYSYYHQQADIQLSFGRCFERLNTVCELIHDEINQIKPSMAVIRELLNSLLIMIEHERNNLDLDQDNQLLFNNQDTTFKSFLQILEENFRRPLGIQYYAEKLFMSAKNLNRITQNILQQSVSEIIETRKLIEAKNLLISTEKSISEIGFEIGYQDKAYFTSVFKKKSGQTPSEFRDEMKNMMS
ncbi:helix-turn-helix domain-containing protein [Sphingobacterium sp. HJSM2_6]|uniref:helix-turn-helix domain-containing protein n=1 Tax=Sphingobacterium sp. HJSM2_6 TaxID=3366264 RepID=UPI003BD1BAE1